MKMEDVDSDSFSMIITISNDRVGEPRLGVGPMTLQHYICVDAGWVQESSVEAGRSGIRFTLKICLENLF